MREDANGPATKSMRFMLFDAGAREIRPPLAAQVARRMPPMARIRRMAFPSTMRPCVWRRTGQRELQRGPRVLPLHSRPP